jgi:hypothetical protein
MKAAALGLALLALPSPALRAAPIAADPEWTLEAADAAGLTLAWKDGHPGAGGGARVVALAVPPGNRAAAAVESAAPGGGSVSVTAPARFRDLSVCALTWDPGAAASASAPAPASARIRVKFSPLPVAGGGASGAWRPAFAPPENAPGETHLRGWLANYAQSRGFRSAPLQAAAPGAGSAGLGKSAAAAPYSASPSAPALPAIRVVLKTKGENIEYVPYEALKAAGAPLQSIDPRHLRLYQDGREVPMYVYGESDGRWDPGDYIEFIGKRPAGTNSWNSFYASWAVFILAWDGGRPGLRAPAVPVASRTGGIVPTFPADAKAAPPFSAHVHLEEDLEILRIGSTSAEEVVDLGSRVQESELTDFWVWKRLGAEKDQAELPLALPYEPAGGSGKGKQASGALRLTVNLKGVTNNPNANPDHHLKFLLNGSDISLVGGVAHDAIWEGQESYTWTSPQLDPSLLKGGKNILTIQKVNDLRTGDGQAVEIQDAFVNWVELDFPSAYKALDGTLAFGNAFSDSAGLRLFRLEGFPEKEMSLWDRQGRKLTNFLMTQSGPSWDAAFLDSLPGRADYLASAASKRERPIAVLDTLDDLYDKGQGADYLVITHADLQGQALDSLTAFRRKQGLRTRVVQARHIYQAFGDGSMDPAAIRRFVAYAYANWARPAPAYLVLVGDASIGFEKSGKTLVPFHPVNIRGWGVAANDDYFAKVAGDDDIADLYVGRLPANDRQQLSDMVHKTLLAETARPMGHWNNKALLISGFESSFMAQNQALQGIAVANDRQYSRIDLFPGSPLYRKELPSFFDQLDSAFSLVSFVGHGGGAVWSDAGVLTLKALGEGKVAGEFPIPLVASITCLTGFFEDQNAPSLGEEMLRLAKGGAAGFYGAAGYISNLAGEALSAEVLRAAASNAYASNGAVIGQAETMVKLRTGEAFLPILAEFNLLGDPAFGAPFPAREGDLAVDPQAADRGTSLAWKASRLAVGDGNAQVTVFLGDSAESAAAGRVAGGSLSGSRAFPAPLPPVQNGKVIVHYWDDKVSRVASAPFSGLDWLIDSVAIEPAGAAPGDSVRIRAKLTTVYPRLAIAGGVAAWGVAGEDAPQFGLDNQIALSSEDGTHLVSAGKIRLDLPAADAAGPKLHVAFRLLANRLDEEGQSAGSLPLSSRTYAIALSELPRLELRAPAFGLPAQDDLGVWVRVRNRGYGTAKGFSVSLARDAEGPDPLIDTVRFGKDLGMGGIDSVFFALADSMLMGKRLRATLIPAKDGDLAASGNSEDTVFRVLTAALGSRSDTLRFDSLGHGLALSAALGKPRRAFARAVPLGPLPAHLSLPQSGSPPTAWRVEAADFPGAGFVLASSRGAFAKAAADKPSRVGWHYRSPQGQAWVRLDSSAGPEGTIAAAGFREGDYALLLNSDATPPLIQISSRGQALLDDDYVPLRTAIDVVLRDGEGMDLALHPPTLASRRQTLDSSNRSIESADGFPTLARLSFTPERRAESDSLVITASDISGNRATRTLAYRMGEKLTIRDLGSYPNPFADTAVIVYSLTDYCDKVDLRVYSRAGRPVRDLSQRNVVGYQEVAWDGRADDGGEVANGLYFLKITAKAGSKEATRVYKLFRKKRK